MAEEALLERQTTLAGGQEAIKKIADAINDHRRILQSWKQAQESANTIAQEAAGLTSATSGNATALRESFPAIQDFILAWPNAKTRMAEAATRVQAAQSQCSDFAKLIEEIRSKIKIIIIGRVLLLLAVLWLIFH
jgi:hypothetical protein